MRKTMLYKIEKNIRNIGFSLFKPMDKHPNLFLLLWLFCMCYPILLIWFLTKSITFLIIFILASPFCGYINMVLILFVFTILPNMMQDTSYKNFIKNRNRKGK